MRKKYLKANAHEIARHRRRAAGRHRRIWADDNAEQFLMSSVAVMRYRRGWMRTPDYAIALGESDA